MLILDSVLWGDRICGGGGVNSMHFLMFFCILGVFLGGIWDSGGESPQEIAGNNTGCRCLWNIICLLENLYFLFDC